MATTIQLQDIILYCLGFFSTIFLWRIFSTYVTRKNNCCRPPEPAGKWPFIGHLHLLGASKILHHTLGDMADKYGPIFSLNLGINRTFVITSWEVAKECFTTQDRVFATRPKSLVGEVVGYNSRVMIFQEYGLYWRQIRKLAMVELLSNRRLDMLKHVRESEVNIFIKELYEKCLSNGNGSKVVVEMKEKFGDLTTNIVVRIVAGWIETLKGYKGKMKKTAEEIDHVLGSWLKEHQQNRENESINHSEEDFIYVMLSAMDGNQFPDIDTDTAIKGTCLSLILGRRSCPGITFATQVLHLTLAQLLHGFELGTVLNSPIDMTESAGITNPKATPLEVTLRPRLTPAVYL
ncbi:Cytochrome P450, family 82, subfamily C, polypeptide 4 [Heracleum sosnowskyi]|uniref:Cytochrome P450, family 82, subfamily C, polypeptide 4 n=1 Tax=Heracleum sosnowskyi TaxID=360622 RepID=A0AAD8GVB7_9APIA|nr:Cytochrome P450, family 82, subfamily C, polypeptide 4 [Heracleum sosnowskyi]